MNNPVLLSIGIITHNHEQFLQQLFHGIFMQKVNFSFEVICFDDASDDKTLTILNNYQSKYPALITVMHNTISKGPNYCAKITYQHFKGKYISWLDGDDYWIYEEKLQKQIDFLDSHPEYNGCFHDAQIVSVTENSISSQGLYFSEYKYYSQFNKFHQNFYPWDVIERNIIPTASLIIRKNDKILSFFTTFSDVNLSLIWALQIFMVKDSKFRYFNEAWSVYNDHPQGISKTRTIYEFKQSNIKILKRFAKDKQLKFLKNSIYRTIANEYRQILISPKISQTKKSYFFKILLLFSYYYFATFRYEWKNIFENNKFNNVK